MTKNNKNDETSESTYEWYTDKYFKTQSVIIEEQTALQKKTKKGFLL